jgi:ubiquinone/menaquinone biosynthesis C-methylase UbiE
VAKLASFTDNSGCKAKDGTRMVKQVYDKSFRGNAAEEYQRFFVPAIGASVAQDLVAVAKLQPGERVLDVACGTGVVARLTAERVGPAGLVAGLDVNPDMLAVARSETPADTSIDWYEASAEAMPLSDGAFDVVLCQMGLQFVPDKLAALREMHRVLDTQGRIHLTVPGPKPRLFAIMSDALASHVDPEAASFTDLVFSMHDVGELRQLLRSAGFREIDVQATMKNLRLPAPSDFLWQYIRSTPMANAAARASKHALEALESDVCVRWEAFVANGSLSLEVGMTTASAIK